MNRTPVSKVIPTLVIVGASLTYDIIDRLSTDENAQCVILVQEKNSGQAEHLSPSNHHGLVPITLFEANAVTELQLRLSGNFCPFTIMSFDKLGSATTFLEIHRDNLRFSRCFFIGPRIMYLTLNY